jgi:hypothetical protein
MIRSIFKIPRFSSNIVFSFAGQNQMFRTNVTNESGNLKISPETFYFIHTVGHIIHNRIVYFLFLFLFLSLWVDFSSGNSSMAFMLKVHYFQLFTIPYVTVFPHVRLFHIVLNSKWHSVCWHIHSVCGDISTLNSRERGVCHCQVINVNSTRGYI